MHEMKHELFYTNYTLKTAEDLATSEFRLPHHLSMKTSRLKKEEIGWLLRYSSTQERGDWHRRLPGIEVDFCCKVPFSTDDRRCHRPRLDTS